MRFISCIAATCIATAALPAQAQEIGDAAKGLAYAKDACANCHAITPDEIASLTPEAPPFVDIANTAGMTATALTVFFRTPHAAMPDLIVAKEDQEDLIAYILSLKGDG